MTERNFKALQNGSDIRGVALEGVPGEPVNLTAGAAELLSAAFAVWLREECGREGAPLKIAVGTDSRLSADSLRESMIRGLMSQGCEVLNCGLCTTPAMFMSTIYPEFQCDGAMMITGSHLPWNRNGLKYFYSGGGLSKKEIARLIEIAEAMGERDQQGGSVRDADLLSAYAEDLKDQIREGVCHPTDYDHPLRGLHVVVDAGNGAGGFYAERVLGSLGADISGSQFLDPDGHFPNHVPNPEDKEAMESIQRAVMASGADLGVIFDTDVDRASVVDESGRAVNKNAIVALAAALAAERGSGAVIVTDSVTSDELTDFLENTLGLRHHRFKRGYKNVIDEAVRLNGEGIDSPLAIETSGHAAFKENHFLDDGAYLATRIIIAAAKLCQRGERISDLLTGFLEPLESAEFRIKIDERDFAAYGAEVLQAVEREAAAVGFELVQPNYEGVRLKLPKGWGDGWFLIRMSLHDPILPLNIECREAGGVQKAARFFEGIFSAYPSLSCPKLEMLFKK